MSHGHKEWNLPLLPGNLLLRGPTHIPEIRQVDGAYQINPGSVSIPKGGSCHGYMVLEGSGLVHKSLVDGEPTLSPFTFPE